MPKGRGSRGGGHKGQRRHFTSPEALEAEKEKEAREKQWRKARGGDEEDSDEDEEKEEKSDASSEESSDEEDDDSKAKGVQHLIDVENPNRVIRKAKKVEQLNPETEAEKPQLSRREREELEKQQARAHYLKMHAAGKTDEARQDLARLALIKKQREEAAKKRDDDKKIREATKAAKTEATNKALGKKT